MIEYGDGHAGHIQRPVHDLKVNKQSMKAKEKPDYLIRLNKKHDSNVQFATLAHELAHLYLGHLGADKFLKTPDRCKKSHETMELEAESVCYIVCYRNNVKPNSEAYLTNFVDDKLQAEDMDLQRFQLRIVTF
ncbi:MAG: ImmA/IrrE family metallo-endopeptidase [Kaistella sp.]